MIALVTSGANDLSEVLTQSGLCCRAFAAPEQALRETETGDALLLLADGWPDRPTVLPESVAAAAREGTRRVLIEFPAALPGCPAAETRAIEFERGVVAADCFGPELAAGRIVMLHDCRFRTFAAADPVLVLARVAGFDTAVYGLPEERFPVLYFDRENQLWVATARLSRFVTSRFAPGDAWPVIWRWLLQELSGETIPPLTVIPQVAPTGSPALAIGAEEERRAAERGTAWFEKARLFIGPDWSGRYPVGSNGYPDGVDRSPAAKGFSCGDGSLGMIEGVNSMIYHDGTQNYRYTVRADCMGEASLALALGGVTADVERWRRFSANLNGYVFFDSYFAQRRRAEPDSASYGLVAWMGNDVNGGVYYGDDNARLLLGSLGAAALLRDGRWLEPAVRCLLANLRTTGPEGFRGERLEDDDLQRNGWRHYRQLSRTHYAPHFESWLWACYLAAYAGSGFRPLLDCAETGLRNMMAAYPERWKWTNGIQQERARLLLPLAFLVRVEDTAEHRNWLAFMVDELLRHQDGLSGAIQEQVGEPGTGMFGPCASNEAYGKTEAPLIQDNADPLSDLLYTANFAFIGLHEAAAATGELRWAAAEDKLAAFLCRIQAASPVHPDLDGAWFRAFDFRRHDYWASNADTGWGAWSVESGWTQAWIAATLWLRQRRQSLWELYGALEWRETVKRCAAGLELL